MTSLRTNLYTLSTFDSLDDSSRRRVLADLESETEELSRLIEEVVEVATDRRGDEPVVDLDLAVLVRRVATRTAARWNRGVFVSGDETVTVLGRVEALGRAIRNLVENACKFDDSGQDIEVLATATAAGAGRPVGAQLEVLDRGPGFDDADIAHVFDRFYRSVSARSLPGSGLGLSIVSEVAAANGGSVFVENRAGGGARRGSVGARRGTNLGSDRELSGPRRPRSHNCFLPSSGIHLTVSGHGCPR